VALEIFKARSVTKYVSVLKYFRNAPSMGFQGAYGLSERGFCHTLNLEGSSLGSTILFFGKACEGAKAGVALEVRPLFLRRS